MARQGSAGHRVHSRESEPPWLGREVLSTESPQQGERATMARRGSTELRESTAGGASHHG